jgi:hypothetical protein
MASNPSRNKFATSWTASLHETRWSSRHRSKDTLQSGMASLEDGLDKAPLQYQHLNGPVVARITRFRIGVRRLMCALREWALRTAIPFWS